MPNHDPQTSLTLLGRIRENDQEAWGQFVRLYGPLVYSWCRSAGLQPADVADVAQNALQVVAGNIHSFEPGRKASGAFRSWLWGVTRFRILDHFRQRDKQTAGTGGTDANILLANLEQQAEEPESVDGITPRQLLLQTAIEMLKAEFDARTWQAFWGMAVEGNSAREIGNELDMTAKAVRQAKFRVTKKLRVLLEDDFPDVLQPLSGLPQS